MNDKENTYKILAIVLLIVAIVLAIFLFQRNDDEAAVEQTPETTASAVESCSDEIAAWRAVNGTIPAASDEAKAELEEILQGCIDTVE